MTWEIREGDCRSVLAELEPESVQCVVTSPPYWALRDYGVEGQLGLEHTPEEYVIEMARRRIENDAPLFNMDGGQA